jgi:hypothetical protein
MRVGAIGEPEVADGRCANGGRHELELVLFPGAVTDAATPKSEPNLTGGRPTHAKKQGRLLHSSKQGK